MSREMKDSGVEWIGKIPKNWDTIPLKRLSKIQTGSSPDKKEGNNNYSDESGIPWIKAENLGEFFPIHSTSEYLTENGCKLGRIYPPYTVYVCCIASIGKVGFSDIECSCNQQINGLSFNNIVNWKFGFYETLASAIEHIARSNKSVTPILNATEEGKIKFAISSPTEQQQIVHFLDRKCTAIDTAIEKTKKSIEKLEEYKKAVITKAVTKHEGWTECKLRFVANIVRGGSPRPIEAYITDGEGLNWVKIGDATGNGKYINNTKQKITKDGLNKTRLVPAGTLLLTNSMSFGHPYVLNIEGCIHDGWLAFFDFEKVTQDYLYYFLESDVAMEQFSRSVEGSVVNNLNIDKVKSSYIAFPSITEQNLIVKRLDRLCIAINAVIEKKKKAIEKWEEYKKSLIYYAVTGKIDCRGEETSYEKSTIN